MCRFQGYIGPSVGLAGLLYGQDYGLDRQAWAPRHQQHGNVNADGWGVGWYDQSLQPEPARYRTTAPMWADRNFPEMAPLISSACVVAAVRDASPGMPVDKSSTAPFMSGRFLLAHNGLIDGFRAGVGTTLRRWLSTRRDSEILGGSDSEVAFAIMLDRLDKGASLEAALREAIDEITSITTGRFNFLLTDGSQLMATRAGDSLYVWSEESEEGHRTAVVSEPLDDGEGWLDIPDRSIVIAARNYPPQVLPL